MKLHERIKKLEELQKVEMPWNVWTTFGKLQLFGDQLSFGTDNDYKSVKDVREALEVLVNELNGSITWKKGAK